MLVSVLLVLGWVSFVKISQGNAAPHQPPCDTPGWFPEDFGLKDHTVFWYDGYYYLMSNYINPETKFAYARSTDFCTWEELDVVLPTRVPGTWDDYGIWAPHVREENGLYYMYFTGVKRNITQSILLATTTDPSDPDSWEKQDMVFQPDHAGMVWEDDVWADCRDPYVMKDDGTYYLFYTGRDTGGGIVGVATASTPTGPWTDMGAIFTLDTGNMAESPAVVKYDGWFYIFYNHSHRWEEFRISASILGPWGDDGRFSPGWAHEVWQDNGGKWYTSYLTDYTVLISPFIWDDFFYPHRPFIGTDVYHVLLPLLSLHRSDLE